MTLVEKLQELTPEQREKLDELKDIAKLDTFLSENALELTAVEKAQVIEFIETGKLPLSDEELDSAAGGGLLDNVKKAVQKVVKTLESRPYTQDPTKCPSCQGDGIITGAHDEGGFTPYECAKCGEKWTLHFD